MKIVRVLVWCLCVMPLLAGGEAEKDVEAIKACVQESYVEGLQNEGNMAKIDRGFHPDFNLLGVGKDGNLWKLPIADWKARVQKGVEEGHYPKKGDKMVTVKFLNVDVMGTAATAKFEFYVGSTLKYVDFLSLYKIDGHWKIVSKIYYKIPE